jgi:hypothetical protein
VMRSQRFVDLSSRSGRLIWHDPLRGRFPYVRKVKGDPLIGSCFELHSVADAPASG